jgi:hypothetical protein
MCERCDELKGKIAHCRRILRAAALDAITTERLEELIRDYEQKIEAMDCQRK